MLWGSRTNLGIKTWMTMMICCWSLLVRFAATDWNISRRWCVHIQSNQFEEFIHSHPCARCVSVYRSRHTLLFTFWEISRISAVQFKSIHVFRDTFEWCLFISRVHVFVFVVSLVCFYFISVNRFYLLFVFNLQASGGIPLSNVDTNVYINANSKWGIIFDRWHDEILAEILNIFE